MNQTTQETEAADLGKRRTYVFAALLLLLGAGAWFVVRPLLPPSAAEWNAQVTQDAVSLTQLLRYDLRLENTGDIDAAWEKRRVLYDAGHLDDLRERLSAFVEFQVREYGAAKDVYLSGNDPKKRSKSELELDAKLRRAFGDPVALDMLSQYGERVREAAYKASPKVAGGEPDPDAPHYDEMYDDLVKDWLPQARATVERLTALPR